MPAKKGVDGLSVPLLKLYSGLSGPDPWVDFLTVIRGQLKANFATIIITPPDAQQPAIVLTPGVPEFELEGARRYFSLDPFVGLPEGEVVSINEFIGKERYLSSAFYQKYVSRYAIEDILGIDLLARSGFQLRMRACCPEGRGGFSEQDRQWLGYFVPHLRAALNLYERLEIQKGEENIYDSAVEQLSIGSIMLDSAGKVIRSNQIARRLLDEQDGIRLLNNRLVFDDGCLDRGFRDFLRGRDAQASSRVSFLQAERTSGKPPLCIMTRRLAPQRHMPIGSCPAYAVFITAPEQQASFTGDAVARVMHLTPMEAEIVASLANGLSLPQIAEVFGISQNTVRAHLRSVFSKVGVSRQSQLVQRVRTSVSGLVVQMSSLADGVRRRARRPLHEPALA